MEGKIGGDSLLSPQGLKYADALPDLITDNIGDAPLTVIFFSWKLFLHVSFLITGLDIDS